MDALSDGHMRSGEVGVPYRIADGLAARRGGLDSRTYREKTVLQR
jgi:hypothetical protein